MNENNGGSVSAIDASSGNYGVSGGRVTQLTVQNQDNVASIRVTDQPDHGNLTVNPDNTLSLVLSMDHEFSGNMSMSYEVTYNDGSTQMFNDNVGVQPTTQAEGWAQGEFYMLEADANNDLVLETGDVHRMVHISGDQGALSAQDIAAMEGLNANQITGDWLANNPQYGSTEASALDVDLGMSLWGTITGSGAEPSSHWLLFENGYDYDADLYMDGVHGEDPLHPIHITSYGDGEQATITFRPMAIGESGQNVVVSDLNFDDGFTIFDANNMILDGVQISDDNETALVIQSLSGKPENITIRDSSVVDAYYLTPPNGADSWVNNPLMAGAFISNADGLLIEGNLFDHNGFAPDYDPGLSADGGQPPQMFNHNLYIDWDNTDVTVRDNIIMRGASFGAQVRGGGFIEDNVLIDNNIGLTFVGGDYEGRGPIGNFSLAADNVITSAGYHSADRGADGALASGIRGNQGVQSTLVDNIVAHLADPNNPDEQANKIYGEVGVQNVNDPFYDDSIIHNWLGSVDYGQTGVNTDGLDQGTLNATTIQTFTQQLLGDPNANIGDLADYLRAQADGQFDDVVDADLIVAYFQAGFGLSVEDRITPETIRFVPDALGDGIRWDNRLNWDTDDLPGTIAGDSVDLAGNWVNYGGTTTLEDLDFGEGGTLNVSYGRLDITDHTAVGEAGGQLNISNAGQVWMDGYTDMDRLDINVDGGRFANTDLFVGNADVDITDGQAILATDNADFVLRDGSELNIVGDDARVGFDGDEGGTGVLLLDQGSELRFTAQNGQLGTIEEFRSGAEGDQPNIQSGVNLGDGTLTLDLTDIGNGSFSGELIRVDEVIGEFETATITGLAGDRDTELVIDYENDVVTLNVTAAGGGSGQNTVRSAGDETDAQANDDLWAALTNGGSRDIIGSELGETLNGTSGDDAIIAIGGNDLLRGGGGNDILDGGDGDDRL
ncbi:right-handed parallel beta-helix repeat-containing protein, partial [Litoreibacter arenae]|uniref:right-handed parallel beta-helix repeat-containing protein n=1 Tax=Litoreibacter arenae TaxID=491388 RepID=UPI00147014BC